MEIRNTLKKIDSYLKIVTELNNTILEEGTMAPEELQIMKKYLLGCIDRIENMQISLGLSNTSLSNEINDYSIINDLKNENYTFNNNEESNIIQENITKEKTEESNNIVSNIVLQADLPSIQFSNEINYSSYQKTIPSLRVVNSGIAESTIKKQNIVNLVADDKETIEEKIEFKTETIEPQNIVNLVADDKEIVEEKIEFKTETIEPQNIVNLVADDKETIEEKIEFKTETIEPHGNFDLVKNEEVNEEEIVSFAKHNAINEYESIISRKYLSESVALNDKFIFVRELFGSQFTEYENNIKKIDEFNTHQEALDYCNNILSTKFNWASKPSIAGRFFEILEKNFAK